MRKKVAMQSAEETRHYNTAIGVSFLMTVVSYIIIENVLANVRIRSYDNLSKAKQTVMITM